MSRTRTMRRYAVPASIAAGALAVAGGVGMVMANADDLPEKSAEELHAAVQNSDVQGLSGTVEQTADLGLPSAGTDSGDPASLASGSHTLGVWYSANDKIRVAMQNDVQETDVIRDGADVFSWNSQSGESRHETLPADAADAPLWSPSLWSMTPSGVAEQATGTAANTELDTDGTDVVAGRDTYGLILSPTDDTSLVDHVRMAVDAETGVPLSTQVFAKDDPESPALEVTFSDVTFGEPDAEAFQSPAPDDAAVQDGDVAGAVSDQGETWTTGSDWTTVGISEMTEDELVDALVEQGADPEAITGYLDELPQVDGGKLLESSLFTALIADDGNIYYGAVSSDALTGAIG